MPEQFKAKRNISVFDAIGEYLFEKEATETLSSTSVYNRKYELSRFAKFCKSHNVENTADIQKNLILSYLMEQKISKSSKLGIIYVLIGFMDYMVDEELILDNVAASISKPKIYAPKADYLTFDELERLYQSEAQNSPPKVTDRNLLLFSLFTDLCLRVSEVINLKLEDVRLDSQEVWVTRKRSKTDNMPLNDDIVGKFLNWYAIRPKYKGNELSWVFLSSHGQQLKRRQVHYIVSQALKRAKIVKRKRGPHLLRHSGASLKARAGENLIIIQYLLGHENLNTTRRYLHFDWEDMKEMVGRSPALGREKE